MKLFRLLLLLVSGLFISAAHAQPAPALHGNWFSVDNTNEWVFGVYDKFLYYKSDFWPYKILPDGRLSVPKLGLVLTANLESDSILLLSTNRGATHPLTNIRGRMAAPEPMPGMAKSATVYLKGYVDQTKQRLITFGVLDPLLGKSMPQMAEADQNGLFTLRLNVPAAGTEITVGFDNQLKVIVLNPGDSVTLYVNDEMLIAGGKSGAFNNELNDYITEEKDTVSHSTEGACMAYQLARQTKADSLLHTYAISKAVFTRLRQRNKYNLPYQLLRYTWLNKPTRIHPSPEYRQLIDSFTVVDSNTLAGSTMFQGFVHELMNSMVLDHLSDRSAIDSFVVARSSPGRAFDYIQQYDKTITPAHLKDIDRFLKYSPQFVRGEGKVALSVSDSSQFGHLMHWMVDNDYFVSYFSNLALQYKMTIIDSLYPKGVFRDYLLGHYLYAHCLDNSRLILDQYSLDQLGTMYSDTDRYQIVFLENQRNKLQFENARYENLLAEPQTETVLNRIARQHKGKAVYVDVWATWCVPCMEQFAHSKELKKELEGKPVAFVYLCCDSDITDWQNMIRKYNLPGQHLLLTPDEKKRLQARYKFGSYPRYMVIDKQGKLISSNSFAPQQKELVVTLMQDLVQ